MWSENVLPRRSTRFVPASLAMRAFSAGPSRHAGLTFVSTRAHCSAEASVGVMCIVSGARYASWMSSGR